VGPRPVLDAVVKRKVPSPRRESKPRTPIVQTVAQRYTDCEFNKSNMNMNINMNIKMKTLCLVSEKGYHNLPVRNV
jgi:hypothetical protein